MTTFAHTGPITEIDVLGITAGLGCDGDGDTIAMTGATQPSIEDMVIGGIPWIPSSTFLILQLKQSREQFLKGLGELPERISRSFEFSDVESNSENEPGTTVVVPRSAKRLRDDRLLRRSARQSRGWLDGLERCDAGCARQATAARFSRAASQLSCTRSMSGTRWARRMSNNTRGFTCSPDSSVD
jgi:hypothetical protein